MKDSMAPCFKAFIVKAEYLDLVPNTHILAVKHLYLQFQGL